MATIVPKSLHIIKTLADTIDAFKRWVIGGAAPSAALTEALSGTGFATSGQTVTTTENFTAAANAYAGCWLVGAAKTPCVIASHPAVTAAPLAFTVYGAAPTTDAGTFKVYRAATPPLAAVGGAVHYDRGEYTVTAADASSEATSITLCQELITAYNRHIADALGHVAADSTNVLSVTRASVVDAATAITAANQLKAAYNAHRAQSGVHFTADTGNAVSSSNATDQSSLNTLLNEMKGDFNAHIAIGPSAASWRATDV